MADDIDTGGTPAIPVQPNVSLFQLTKNRRDNEAAGWAYLPTKWRGMDEIILLGGGPSLNYQLEVIRELWQTRRCPLITTNGAYHWAIKNHLWPAMQIVLDSRPESARFTHPRCPGTKYLLVNTCHPETLANLSKKNAFLWDRDIVNGGSTVMLCAVPLLKILGMKYCHIFGMDSCVMESGHHAYKQDLNDGEPCIDVEVKGRLFRTTWWMSSQAEEFLELSPNWGDFKVYGDGLIAHMLYGKDDLDDDGLAVVDS